MAHFGTPACYCRVHGRVVFRNSSGEDPDPRSWCWCRSRCPLPYASGVVQLRTPRHLEIELWETDEKLVPHLRQTMAECRRSLLQGGHRLDFTLYIDDFILANAHRTLFMERRLNRSISPSSIRPTTRFGRNQRQAKAMEHVVHGQPNIYAFFMAVTTNLLAPGGEMVAITPRSYFNGPYFKRFRYWFFQRMSARHIHLFESRTEAFNDDKVLQENVILLAEKGGKPRDIVTTTSVGRDLGCVHKQSCAYNNILDTSSEDCVVRVTTNNLERQIVVSLDALPNRFHNLGLGISTGPVVTFRATEYLRQQQSKTTVPLLWMHNVRPFVTRIGATSNKPNHIEATDLSMRLLVPARRYVLLKCF